MNLLRLDGLTKQSIPGCNLHKSCNLNELALGLEALGDGRDNLVRCEAQVGCQAENRIQAG